MKELLAARRTPIIDEWFARTLESYPPQAARLLAGVTDRFRNPAGHLLRDNLATIFDQCGESQRAIRHINEYRKLTR